jgi:hypothetical protein
MDIGIVLGKEVGGNTHLTYIKVRMLLVLIVGESGDGWMVMVRGY